MHHIKTSNDAYYAWQTRQLAEHNKGLMTCSGNR
jgi:hypothetical protein